MLETTYFSNLSMSNKIIHILKSHESYGGPQSSENLLKILKVKRKNLDSVLSRMALKGSIIRVKLGVYRYPGDNRTPKI